MQTWKSINASNANYKELYQKVKGKKLAGELIENIERQFGKYILIRNGNPKDLS